MDIFKSLIGRRLLLFLLPVALILPGANCWAQNGENPGAATVQQSPQESREQRSAILPTAEKAAPVVSQGLRVYRDPATGHLGAPPAGIRPPGLSVAEQNMLNRSGKGLKTRTLPNGAVVLDLQGRFMSMAVATSSPKGKPAVNCALTPAEAQKGMQKGPAIEVPGP